MKGLFADGGNPTDEKHEKGPFFTSALYNFNCVFSVRVF
jgi:hypothetical protein